MNLRAAIDNTRRLVRQYTRGAQRTELEAALGEVRRLQVRLEDDLTRALNRTRGRAARRDGGPSLEAILQLLHENLAETGAHLQAGTDGWSVVMVWDAPVSEDLLAEGSTLDKLVRAWSARGFSLQYGKPAGMVEPEGS